MPWRLLLAEPPVQHWPFAARALAHTGIWTAWLLALQALLLAVVRALAARHLKRLARTPTMSGGRLFLENVLGYTAWFWPVGLLSAWLNPGAPGGWRYDYDVPNLLCLAYFALGSLLIYDAYSFFLHRFLHLNKWAYRFHAKHHSVQAELDLRTSGHMSVVEGFLSAGLPLLALVGGAAVCTGGNFWYVFAGTYNALFIILIGHAGHALWLDDPRDLPLLALNPFALMLFGLPVRATPMEHEAHHEHPRTNFAFFTTFWDDWYGSSRLQRPRCTPLVLAAHAAFQAAFWACLQLAVRFPGGSLALVLIGYVLAPPAAAAAVSEALGLPEACRRVAGSLADRYRDDSAIAVAPPGFQPAAAAAEGGWRIGVGRPSSRPAAGAAADAAAPRDTDGGASPPAAPCRQPPVFVFAVHPAGLLSRAAFTVFGARGWTSPVSGLPRVRLAAGSQLFFFPLVREFLLACGCLPADRGTLQRALASGTSVAVTPGGWREADHLQTLNLVLAKRRGFVALAAETGAQLVPVLSLGEQDLVGRPTPGFKVVKWLLSQRPHPVRVAFGEPLAARPGETVAQLHARYVDALMALGKLHGVSLRIVE